MSVACAGEGRCFLFPLVLYHLLRRRFRMPVTEVVVVAVAVDGGVVFESLPVVAVVVVGIVEDWHKGKRCTPTA